MFVNLFNVFVLLLAGNNALIQMKRKIVFILVLSFIFAFACTPLSAGDTLQVAVYDSPPFGFVYEDGSYGGLMVEIWEDIASELKLGYKYSLTDMDGLLNGLQNKIFDVGLGAISITPRRETMVDFTQPVNPSGTGIAVISDSFKNSIFAYAKPIILSLARLILSLSFLLVVAGTLVWFFERRKNPEIFEKRIHGLGDGLWWAAVTMTTVGYGDKVPKTKFGRVIAIAWMFIGIIMVSLFTADASSIFTTVKLDSHIQTVDDLRSIRVGAASKSSGQEFLLREHLKHTAFEHVEDALNALLNNEIEAVVSNVPVLLYLNKHKYNNKLIISSKLLLKNNMGIALTDESPLREKIDQILLQKITEPKWQNSAYKYLGEVD